MARFNVEFSPEALKVLEDLAQRQGVTKAEVLRRAIAFEKWFQDAVDRGARITVVEEDGRVREVLAL